MKLEGTNKDAGRVDGAMNEKPLKVNLPTVPLSESHCKGDPGVIATQCVSNPMERS